MRDNEQVVVIAAGSAWPFYQLTSAYVCQVGRTFRSAGRMSFYSGRQIHGLAAVIQQIVPELELTEAEAARRSLSMDPVDRHIGAALVEALREDRDDTFVQIVLLSSQRSDQTLHFSPLAHHGGQAWTKNQRYVTTRDLLSARTTSDLTSEESPSAGEE
ncbi:hypothetical protein GCM10027020_32490 [Nocardioides salsibiostraticola]